MRSSLITILLVFLSFQGWGLGWEHTELHDSIISYCHALPFPTLYLKTRCIIKREDVTCAEILARCKTKFPQFTLMDSRQLEPVFVKHVQKLAFFKSFKATPDFCVIVNGYECPTNFFEFNGFCFRSFPQRKDHPTAKKSCHEVGARLIEIPDDRMNTFLESLVVKTFKEPTWLGIERNTKKNEWKTFNGTHDSLPVYFRWMFFTKGHDNAVMEYGVYNGYWRSAKPNEMHPFVCQRKAVELRS